MNICLLMRFGFGIGLYYYYLQGFIIPVDDSSSADSYLDLKKKITQTLMGGKALLLGTFKNYSLN